jgi:hypothetical protein
LEPCPSSIEAEPLGIADQCDRLSLVGIRIHQIAWPRPYTVSPDAPWWQLWAVLLVLGSILGMTTLSVLIDKIRSDAVPE